MNKTDDPFDGKLGLDLSDPAFAHLSDPTIAPKTGGQPKRKASEWKRYYTLFPYSWQERLRGCKAGSIFLLALYLLYEHWRSGGHRIRLSNGVLAAEGVGRNAKLDGLRELERRGLVQVEWRPRRAPLVTCLLMGTVPGTSK
jgi:hypothetical protein